MNTESVLVDVISYKILQNIIWSTSILRLSSIILQLNCLLLKALRKALRLENKFSCLVSTELWKRGAGIWNYSKLRCRQELNFLKHLLSKKLSGKTKIREMDFFDVVLPKKKTKNKLRSVQSTKTSTGSVHSSKWVDVSRATDRQLQLSTRVQLYRICISQLVDKLLNCKGPWKNLMLFKNKFEVVFQTNGFNCSQCHILINRWWKLESMQQIKSTEVKFRNSSKAVGWTLTTAFWIKLIRGYVSSQIFHLDKDMSVTNISFRFIFEWMVWEKIRLVKTLVFSTNKTKHLFFQTFLSLAKDYN